MKKLKLPFVFLLCGIMALSATACTPDSENNGSDTGSQSVSSQEISSGGGEQSTSEEDVTGKTFTVTFNPNYSGAPKPSQSKVKGGEAVSEPEEPVRQGYGFIGWYTDNKSTNLYDFSQPVTKNMVLYAGWSSDVVVVTFNYNYVGAPAMVKQTLNKGESAVEPERPSRQNYAFAGWYTDAAGSDDKAFDFASALNGDVTLYAKWTLTDAVVTYDLNYPDCAEPVTESVKVGEKTSAITLPERERYNFVGWYTDKAGEMAYDFDAEVTRNFTLYAKWEIKTYKVTFDYNYTGAPAAKTETVEHGNTVTEPVNDRTGYVCTWQYNGEQYDFSTPVTGDITLVATWSAESSDNITATFYYNYDGAPNGGVYDAQTVRLNYRPSVPEEPVREGYYFLGWYTDTTYATEYNFNKRLTSSVVAYAKWCNKYTFEAEYVDLDGKPGHGYSVNTSGTDLVKKDNGTAEASNGYYVSDLYYNGSELKFVVNSDREVNDAIVIIRIQVEHYDMTFDPSVYAVRVNGTDMTYEEIAIEAGEDHGESDIRTEDRRPFIDVVMTSKAHLNAGENIITLTATNDADFDVGGRHSGTMNAVAPMVDCIYVCTDATLTWTPKTSNIEK